MSINDQLFAQMQLQLLSRPYQFPVSRQTCTVFQRLAGISHFQENIVSNSFLPEIALILLVPSVSQLGSWTA